MRRRAAAALIVAGMVADGTVFVRSRFGGRGTEEALPDDHALFTEFAPGGPQAFWCNGPVGWLTSRIMPIAEAGVYRHRR